MTEDKFDSTDDKRVDNLPGDPDYSGPDHVSLSYKALGDEEKELMRKFKVDCQTLINKVEAELGSHPELDYAIRHLIDASASITRYITRFHADNKNDKVTVNTGGVISTFQAIQSELENKLMDTLKRLGVPVRFETAATDTKMPEHVVKGYFKTDDAPKDVQDAILNAKVPEELSEDEKKEDTVYSRPYCTFVYCPHPETCKKQPNGCVIASTDKI